MPRACETRGAGCQYCPTRIMGISADRAARAPRGGGPAGRQAAGWRTRGHRLTPGQPVPEDRGSSPGQRWRFASGSGYFPCMARPRLPDSALVPIGLKVSETDAARIDEVLGRPEFAGWTRSEWCREIIRTALRYYTGDTPAADRRPDRPAEPPAAAQPAAPAQAASPAQPAAVMAATVRCRPRTGPGPLPRPAAPSPWSLPRTSHRRPRLECAHPAEARDYETGTCAACGAVLWD